MRHVLLTPRGTAVERFLRAAGRKPPAGDAKNPELPAELFKAIAENEIVADVAYYAWELTRCATEELSRNRGRGQAPALRSDTGRGPGPETGRGPGTETGGGPGPETGRGPGTETDRRPGPETGRRLGPETDRRAGACPPPQHGNAETALELSAKEQRAVAFLVAALFLAEFSGSTLVPLEPKSALDSLLRRLGANEKDQAQVWALLEPKGLERLSTLVGGAADYRPLVLDGPRLYLQRLHDFEGRLVAAMGARRAAVPVKRQGVKAALDEVLAQPAHDAAGRAVVLSGEQQRAVLCALHLPMTAITGGPGTGKTSIVVSILRLLVRLGVAPERIALAAPTGKAANRMKESVQRALDSLRSPGDADARLAKSLPEPRTLHRLLGYSPGRDRFVHHQGNPLAEEVVIVDEGSMIDLAMMDRLVRAVRPEAQLVLLGDADQLPSVDAGAVFRDAVPRDGGLGAKPWDKLVDGELPVAPKGQAKDGRDSYTVRLSKCFRMAEAEALQAAAEAVNRADVAALLGPKGVVVRATAAELKFEGVELLSCASPQELNAFLKVWLEKRLRALDGLNELLSSTWCFTDGAVDEAQAASLLSLRRLYESCRVLCVTRSGARPTGAAAVNRALRELWRAALGQDDSRAVFAPGEPVMMLRNDYAHNLFNGDHGFVLRAGEPGEAVALRAVFPRGAGYGLFPAEDSGAGFQHSFAMTVHKSQGSEYEQVALVLPDEEGHPLLTREILYTALTRAKKSVVIVGRPEVLRQGVAAQLERHSGIGARLAVP